MKTRYRTALFDLDGTLTDSNPGIINSVKYALNRLGREIPSEETLRKFLGPPLVYSFTEFCGFSEEDAIYAAEIYRSRYKDFCVIENALFESVSEMLETLNKSGVTLAVATTKPENMAVRIAEHFGISRFFTAICGSEPDGSNGDKALIIRKALERCRETDLGQAVMVGDRFYDIDGARTVGLDSVGVLYGYGSREELESAGATYLASSAEEITNIITGGS